MILQEKVIEPDDIRKGFMEIHMIIQERKLKKVYQINFQWIDPSEQVLFLKETEKIVIAEILRALRVNKERDGFFLYNPR